MKSSIAVIGTGRMGSAIARALLQAGHRTTVWNRSIQKAQSLAASGAAVATSLQQAADGAEVIIVSVSDYQATADIFRNSPVASAIRGKLIVQLTSGTPQEAREATVWYEERGAGYLDGAIMATPDFIGTDGGTILISGASPAYEAVQEILGKLGGNVQHLGEDPGLANALDCALLALMWGAMFGTLQAIAVCQAEKIDLGVLARQWRATVPVVEGLVSDLIKRTDARRFAGDDETLASISSHYGSLQHLIELMEARGIDRSVVHGYETIFQRAITAGHSDGDFAVLSQFLREPAQA